MQSALNIEGICIEERYSRTQSDVQYNDYIFNVSKDAYKRCKNFSLLIIYIKISLQLFNESMKIKNF